MYFDSHCHLTDDRFAGEAAEAASRAREAGVTGLVIIASDEEDAAGALALAGTLDVWSTAGIHPHVAERAENGLSRVRELAEEPRVVAIGETGLDYYYDNAPRGIQRASFERQLDLAAATGKPVVVHSRESDEDMIAMVRGADASVTGVLHCFAGSPALFEAGIEAGWYVSFSGLVTFGSYGTPELVAETPEDRLLIETDAPDMLPPDEMRARELDDPASGEAASTSVKAARQALERLREATNR